jgi:transcription elongation factor GreA
VTKIVNDGKVIFGATVDLENLDTGEKITYKIVGKDEADLKKKLIFYQSPIGKGLIGKNKKDLVEINTPAGVKNFEIKDVRYI